MSRETFEQNVQKLVDEDRVEAVGMDAKYDAAHAEMEAIAGKKLDRPKAKAESGKENPEKVLSFEVFQTWFKENGLEKYLNLETQIAEQEKFYGEKIDRSKLSVTVERLPAIKAGLENGCVNQVLLNFPEEIGVDSLKKAGLDIWAEKGNKDRWTKLTLDELLQRGIPVEPEEIDPEAFAKDWVAETIRVIEKSQGAKMKSGAIELVFTSNLPDIPRNQKVVNKDGKVVTPENGSYISAITNKIQVLSQKEGMRLAILMQAKDGTKIAFNTWEWRRDLVGHRDKKTNPPVLVANAHSRSGGLDLNSSDAGNSDDNNRFRVAL